MNRAQSGAVELRDLTDTRELDGLFVLHLVSEGSPVRDLALISDLEDIGAVGPDTVILLAPGETRGGWMISAALRYAWERRACAVIIPEQPFTASVIELAKRLGVSLLSTRRDMTRLALDVAIRIGAARAESAARVRSAVDRLAAADDPAQAVALLSGELDGAPVWVESAGVRTFAAPAGAGGEPRPSGPPVTLVRADLSPRDGDDGALRAAVPAAAAGFAEALLAGAAPSLRALLLELRLAATHDSLPAVAITALTGLAPVAAFDEPAFQSSVGISTGPFDDAFHAVCLLSDEPERLGALVHQLWRLAFPDSPLARFDGGWIGFLPVTDPERGAESLDRVRDGLVHTAGLPLAGGASQVHRSAAEARHAVREAWLAARLADPSPDAPRADAFVDFGRIPARLLGRLVPADLAAQLVDVLYPRLLGDPGARQIIDTVLAYLSSCGSVSAAAVRLGAHRNTVQTRLRRAEELGVTLSDPADVLPAHLLLAALRRRER